ncbi:hypothetical protein FRC12_002961 [Ceratobasidium sp. 428]|nr:hypothetical protein FRC12_002961 [Ceratobasidium sp. 428]
MDTGEDLNFNNRGPAFLVPEIVESVEMPNEISIETSIRNLVEFYSPIIKTSAPDKTYAKALQDAIKEGLNERVVQVWQWALVNTSSLPPQNKEVGGFFSTLNVVALAMQAPVRLCLADCCSHCDRICLRPYNHPDNAHLCDYHQSACVYATRDHSKQTIRGHA